MVSLPLKDERATRVHRVMKKGTHMESHHRLATRIPCCFRGQWVLALGPSKQVPTGGWCPSARSAMRRHIDLTPVPAC